MVYFTGCRSIEDVKETFRKWAKQLHPDNGGDAEEFKRMKKEYEYCFDRYKDVHRTAAGETYTAEEPTTETPDEYADIIEALMHMDGVTVEIIGSWIWCTGNTMTHHEAIKGLGFCWSRSKKAWYYTGNAGHKPRKRGRYNMDGLRSKWGSATVGTGKDDGKKIA